MNTVEIIEKWYKKLSFPAKYDDAFYAALQKISVSPDATLEAYDKNSEDGIRNLLHYLYFCERTAQIYASRGISEEILMDTLGDIVIWTNIWSDLKGTLFLGELSWLALHMSGRLHKLGRLQFCIPAPENEKGRGTIEIHIPATGKLTSALAQASIDEARSFFTKHYPAYEYDRFTCHSWLLDGSLIRYLSEKSNIIQFGNLFTRTASEPDDSALRYVFRWDITRETLNEAPVTSSLAARLKQAVADGDTFFLTFGYILK